jgi:hypothetical protein
LSFEDIRFYRSIAKSRLRKEKIRIGKNSLSWWQWQVTWSFFIDLSFRGSQAKERKQRLV